MMKAKHSFSRYIIFSLSMILWGFGLQTLSAQMSCAGGVSTVPLDPNNGCSADITLDMVTTAFAGLDTEYSVELDYPAGTTVYVPPITLDESHIGIPISVTVTHLASGVRCWANIMAEDKIPPVISCPAPFTIQCDELADFLAEPPAVSATATDCDDVDITFTIDDSNLDLCVNSTITRVWTATDKSGNSMSCPQIISVLTNPRPLITWPLDTVLNCPEDETMLTPDDLQDRFGNGSGYAYPSLGISEYCGQISFGYEDAIFYTCLPSTHSYKIRRVWEALDWCDQSWSAKDTQFIKVVDLVPPTAAGLADITIAPDSDECEVELPTTTVSITDNCDPNPEVIDVEYYTVIGSPVLPGGACGELFISEYVEGTSATDNKCIEVFNPGNVAVDLSALAYSLRIYFNGSTGSNTSIELTGSVAARGVYVVCVTGPGAPMGADQYDDDLKFNGNDAVELMRGDDPVDVIGEIGNDEFFAQDITLRRNASVLSGDWNGTDSFDPMAEWTSAAVNDITDLGDHVADSCPSASSGTPSVLPGSYIVAYTVADACGNDAVVTQNVRVEDNISPVAGCFQNLVFSLSNDGWVQVCVDAVDNGSADNCAILERQVRAPDLPSPQRRWEDCVTFYCDDVGSQIIELGVWDTYGNFNLCWATVLIEDKVPPQIFCPPNVTLDCNIDITNPANTGGFPQVLDACDNLTPTFADNTLGYNCTGIITRTWTVEKEVQSHGGTSTITATCEQTITVVDNTPALVEFPEDITIDCGSVVGVKPSDLEVYNEYSPLGQVIRFFDEPILEYDCEHLGVSYSDEIFDVCLPTGYKIRREWHVIDWCDPNFDLVHFQEIVVDDSEAPEIDVDDITVNISNNDDGCREYVTLVATATDNCSVVDFINDSQFSDSGSEEDASGYYPKGVHTVCFRAIDDCGNFSVQCVRVTVLDGKAPVAACTPLEIDIKPTQIVEITPQMVDAGSTDNCVDDQNLSFLLQQVDANDTPIDDPSDKIIFDCSNIGFNYVRLWVFDGAPLVSNGDYCVTTVYVQDNFDNCPNSVTTAIISGLIQTEEGDDIDDVDVLLDGVSLDPSFPGYSVVTDMNENHTILPQKDIDGRNGVSTWDIVLIRKHILNRELFDSPYKWIAADVNKDQKISTSDILNLRQYILNSITELPNRNTSWRFIDKAYNFTTNNPLNEPFNEHINMYLTSDYMDADFVGVKVGDVSGDVVPNQFMNADDRNTNGVLRLMAEEQSSVSEDQLVVDIKAADLDEVLGFQFTLDFNKDHYTFKGIRPGSLAEFSESNLGLSSVKDGMIAFSWDSQEAFSPEENEVLFSLVFEANANVKLSENVAINSSLLKAEAYTSDLGLKDIELIFGTDETDSEAFVLYQNSPNPFDEITKLAFEIPTDSRVDINIYDVNGRRILSTSGEFNKGYNEVEIRKDDLKGTGIFYYEVLSDGYRASKKMVLMQRN